MTEVSTAAFAIARAPDKLTTVGIGSCIVICLYAPSRQVGALLHCMLPHATSYTTNPALYADTALQTVLEELAREGIQPTALTAKLVGGAEMFPVLQKVGTTSIGRRNQEQIAQLLQGLAIPVVSTCVGGNRGRSLVLDLSTGNVDVSEVITAMTQTI